MRTLTIYKKLNCMKCRMTEQVAKKLGYHVVLDELFDDEGELNTVPKFYVDTYDMRTSPIVTLSDDNEKLVDAWCDFRIDLLNEYAKENQ